MWVYTFCGTFEPVKCLLTSLASISFSFGYSKYESKSFNQILLDHGLAKPYEGKTKEAFWKFKNLLFNFLLYTYKE